MIVQHPPLCRFCGKPIPKKTICVTFVYPGRMPKTTLIGKYERFIEVVEMPRGMADVKRHVHDLEVLTVRDHPSGEGTGIAFGWDGVSYRDLYFCNPTHAREFGYACAMSGMGSMNHAKSIEARNPERPACKICGERHASEGCPSIMRGPRERETDDRR
jgi:hypothetical protein